MPRVAVLLGPIHRGVGAAQELERGFVAGAHGDAERRADEHFALSDDKGSRRVHRRRGARPANGLEIGRARAQDDELVAAQARHDVADTNGARDPIRHEHEELVARVVAQPVVQELEPVEVDEHHSDDFVRTARVEDRGAGAVEQCPPIGETGELVACCRESQRVLHGALVADVADHRGVVVSRADLDVGDSHVRGERLAVRPRQGRVDLAPDRIAGPVALDEDGITRQEARVGLTDHLRGTDCEDAFRGRVEALNDTDRVDRDDGVVGRFDDAAVPLLRHP